MKKFYVDLDLNSNDLTNGIILDTNTLNAVAMELGSDENFDIYYRNASGDLERLAPNTTTTKQHLSMTGDGTNGTAPVWDTIAAATIQKYSADFTASTGTTITAATHGCGAEKSLIVNVYEDGTPNNKIAVDISVANNGDVTWASTTAFDWHVVIIG